MSRHLESKLQINCVRWFKIQFPMHILYAVPNGIYSSKLQGKIAKDEGMLAGVADLVLMYGNDQYHSLYIEMKTAKGVQSESQKIFERRCKIFGFKYVICRSFEEFRAEITEYLKNN